MKKRSFLAILFIVTLTVASCSQADNASGDDDDDDVIADASPSSLLACQSPLPLEGEIITVSNLKDLKAAVIEANEREDTREIRTLLVEDGTYSIGFNDWMKFTAPKITLRSKSGNRDAVVFKGGGMGVGQGTQQIFHIKASDITIADVTVGWVVNHPIQIFGEKNAHRPHIRNVRFVDGGEQLLKGSYNPGDFSKFSEGGIVECSTFEYTKGVGPGSYVGGIDVHNGKNWIVRDNTFKGIRNPYWQDGEQCLEGKLCKDYPAEHAIHFWSQSENTIAERNVIINCDRGIGYGLLSPSKNRGHKGGIIRNNMIYHDSTWGDVGIQLESAVDVKVYNNTIIHEHDCSERTLKCSNASIDYRYPTTTLDIKNNLSNREPRVRNDAAADFENNNFDAEKGWFLAPELGDLRLKDSVDIATSIGASLL